MGLGRVDQDKAVVLEVFVEVAGDTVHAGMEGHSLIAAEDNPEDIIFLYIPEDDEKVVPVCE